MKTLMIVEDEKMIRKGLAAMARAANVPIEKIIECRNGREALEVMEAEPVDAMLTDIRMPKMDGLELAGIVSQMPHPPKIVVVSGYDDFNYAVEMLKNGVIDYILKPVKREKVEEVLKKMDAMIADDNKYARDKNKVFLHELSFILSGELEGGEDFRDVRARFDQWRNNGGFYAAVSGRTETDKTEAGTEELLKVRGEEGTIIYLFREEMLEDIQQKEYIAGSFGISDEGDDIACLKRMTSQAYDAYEEAYIRCKKYAAYQEEKSVNPDVVPQDFAEKFVQCFTGEAYDKMMSELERMVFLGKHGRISARTILDLLKQIQTELQESYSPVLSEDVTKKMAEVNCHDFSDVEAYMKWLRETLSCMRTVLKERFDVDKNKAKVYEAVAYINSHYQEDLNMAIVSNYVSMNYSLFSIVFKECMGVNFINYLKNLRISEAKRLLEETDEKIVDISKAVGYENEKHFMKTFKAICGVSPSDYRKNHNLNEKSRHV